MRADQRAKRDAFLDKIGSRPVVMGILNLTPDSFSDGGRFVAAEEALSHAKRMAAEGCDIIDVGGELTRPGALPVAEAEELARIEAVFTELAGRLDVPLSIDTYKANVATRAVELGAVLVNDVWGLQKDPAMADAVAAAEAAVVVMHNRAEKDPSIDIIADIRRFFARSFALAEKAGIPQSRIILDPGIAFGKTSRQNVEVIARLGEISGIWLPDSYRRIAKEVSRFADPGRDRGAAHRDDCHKPRRVRRWRFALSRSRCRGTCRGLEGLSRRSAPPT